MPKQHASGPWSLFDGKSSSLNQFQIVMGSRENTCPKMLAVVYETTDNFEEWTANARLIAAAPDLLQAARCALADLEGIMPDFEPSGDREHPAWKTIEELKAAISKATFE